MIKKNSLRAQLSGGSLNEAIEESYAAKDSFSFKGIFEPSKVKGMSFWKPGPGQHIFDILPYIAGSKNPRRKQGKAAYIVDIFVHRSVGPNEDQYVCLAKSFNEPCPICEYRKEREDAKKSGEDVSDEEIKALKPSRRAIYAIWDGDDQKKGVQLYEVAHWFMENPIQSIVKKPKRGGGLSEAIDFPHPDNGKSVAFEIKAVGKNRDYTGHQFVDRDEPIPDEILEAVPVVDELLHIPSYDEVHAAFYGGSVEVEEPVSQVVEEEDPEVEEEVEAEEEVVEEEVTEEEPEVVVQPKKELKPKQKLETKTMVLECPFSEYGSIFGAKDSYNAYQECEECEIREACGTAAAEDEAKKPGKFKPIKKA